MYKSKIQLICKDKLFPILWSTFYWRLRISKEIAIKQKYYKNKNELVLKNIPKFDETMFRIQKCLTFIYVLCQKPNCLGWISNYAFNLRKFSSIWVFLRRNVYGYIFGNKKKINILQIYNVFHLKKPSVVSPNCFLEIFQWLLFNLC